MAVASTRCPDFTEEAKCCISVCGINHVTNLLSILLGKNQDHQAKEIVSYIHVLQVLFVPYALRKQDEYAATARKAFEAWGFTFSSIHTAENPYLAASEAQVINLLSGWFKFKDII